MTSLSLKITVCTLVICFIMESVIGGKKDDDDDGHESSEECYKGKNCVSGCYCSGNDCRPYNPPRSPEQALHYCKPKNWKYWKKGSKGNDTTVVVMPHHQEQYEIVQPITEALRKSNFTTFVERLELESPELKTTIRNHVGNESTTTVPTLRKPPTSSPELVLRLGSKNSQ